MASIVPATFLIAASLALASCNGGQPAEPRDGEADPRTRGSPVALPPTGVIARNCEIGTEVSYFVPGATPKDPAIRIGCVRVQRAREPVEFSANAERLEAERLTCINPAFDKGNYIPAICPNSDVVHRFTVLDGSSVGRRRHRVFMVWGTAPARTTDVTLQVGDEATDGVVIKVADALARRVGAVPRFAVFVAALDVAAACRRPRVVIDRDVSRSARGASRACKRFRSRSNRR